MNTTVVLVSLLVATWCVFAPAIAYRRGQKAKVRELLPLLRESSRLMQEHQNLIRNLLNLRATPAQTVAAELERYRRPHD